MTNNNCSHSLQYYPTDTLNSGLLQETSCSIHLVVHRKYSINETGSQCYPIIYIACMNHRRRKWVGVGRGGKGVACPLSIVGGPATVNGPHTFEKDNYMFLKLEQCFYQHQLNIMKSKNSSDEQIANFCLKNSVHSSV